MKISEILEKEKEVREVLHVKSKEAEKEGDVQISIVIIKDKFFNKRRINVRKEVYKEAQFDSSVLLSDCNAGEFSSIEYKTPVELEIVLLGAQRKYNVVGFHVVSER